MSAALVLSASAAACGEDPAQVPVPPSDVAATWQVTHVRDGAVPDVLYLFDPEVVDGRVVSVHFILDSAELLIRADGRYEHRVRVSEWVGQPGGPPEERAFGFYHGDHGYWTRSGNDLFFESDYLQNHRMTGTIAHDGVLHMMHGFSHGDPAVPLRYGRRP